MNTVPTTEELANAVWDVLVQSAVSTVINKLNGMPFESMEAREEWARAHPEVIASWMMGLLDYSLTDEFKSRIAATA